MSRKQFWQTLTPFAKTSDWTAIGTLALLTHSRPTDLLGATSESSLWRLTVDAQIIAAGLAADSTEEKAKKIREWMKDGHR